jgi:hypothetical protein
MGERENQTGMERDLDQQQGTDIGGEQGGQNTGTDYGGGEGGAGDLGGQQEQGGWGEQGENEDRSL